MKIIFLYPPNIIKSFLLFIYIFSHLFTTIFQFYLYIKYLYGYKCTYIEEKVCSSDAITPLIYTQIIRGFL